MLVLSLASIFAGGVILGFAFLRACMRSRRGATPIDLPVIILCFIGLAAMVAPYPMMFSQVPSP